MKLFREEECDLNDACNEKIKRSLLIFFLSK